MIVRMMGRLVNKDLTEETVSCGDAKAILHLPKGTIAHNTVD